MGYARAGFDPVGIDNDPVPLRRYHFECHLMDWRDGLEKFAADADLIHASPPCQRYSVMTPGENRASHPDLISEVRTALEATGTPWVIENVPGAPLRHPVRLCGCMFGLTVEFQGKTYGLKRRRIFEANWKIDQPWEPHHRDLPFLPVVHDMPRSFRDLHPGLSFMPGDIKREIMECGWMSDEGVTQAVPPAFTECIGKQWGQRGQRGDSCMITRD